MGGLTRNPHAIDRNTCGSSSGSGAAIAVRVLPGEAIGTEGTKRFDHLGRPASRASSGLKPSVGIVSRTNVVPDFIDPATPPGR